MTDKHDLLALLSSSSALDQMLARQILIEEMLLAIHQNYKLPLAPISYDPTFSVRSKDA